MSHYYFCGADAQCWFDWFAGPTAAAWLQAVGTLLAIWFAYAAGSRQHKIDVQKDIIREARAIITALDPVHDLLEEMVRIGRSCTNMLTTIKGKECCDVHPEYAYLINCSAALDQIPVHVLPGKRVGTAVIAAQSRGAGLVNTCSIYGIHAGVQAQRRVKELGSHVAVFEESLKVVEGAIENENLSISRANFLISRHSSWKTFSLL